MQLTGYDAATNPPSPPIGIDAGFATLDPGVQWSAEVIATGEGGAITTEKIAGPHPVDGTEALFDMTTTPPKPIYPVHKRGARTAHTDGWLVAINTTGLLPYRSLDGSVTKNLKFPMQLKIQPQDPTVFFSLEGDSGSVILNAASQVVGLLFGVPLDTQPPTTPSLACPIAEVQSKLSVVVADSTTYSGPQTVPTPATAPHAFTALPASKTVLRERIETARGELTTTDMGQELDIALHRHFGEIRGLVNLNKRAAAVWRRVAGPAWIGEALELA